MAEESRTATQRLPGALNGLGRRRRRRGGPVRVPWALVLPALTLAVIAHWIAPAAGALYAFTDWNGIESPTWIGLDNFREIFRVGETKEAFFHTIELAAVFFVLVNGLGLALALALNRTLKSRMVLRTLFFVPLAMSPVAVSYIWLFIFDYPNGALNQGLDAIGLDSWVHPWLSDPDLALWMVLIVLVWQFTGLAMVIFLAGLQGIPDELMEASAIDGAGSWTQFRRITFPLLAPAITVSATLSLIVGLRVFDQVVALTQGGPAGATETLATQAYTQTFTLGRFGYGAAVSLVLAALITVVAIGQLMALRMRERAV